MVGTYIRHQQCERWLSLSFMPPDQRPPGWRVEDTDLGALRVDSEPDRSFVLSQAVLILPSVLGWEDDWLCRVYGVDIPDLIRVLMGDRGPLIEVGDIKDSPMPYGSQKWPVAFYALMLKELIRPQVQAEVAASGFLILRPRPRTEAPEQHRFDLLPYLAAFPMLFRNVGEVLLKAPWEATYWLQTHCTTCPNFEHCYQEALRVEDVLFLLLIGMPVGWGCSPGGGDWP